MVTKKDVIDALKKVYDPEIPVNIVDLGFIYDVKVNGNNIHIKMTLTTPGCPMHSMLTRQVQQNVEKLKGVESVDVELIWDPPWSPENMSEEAKKQLGL